METKACIVSILSLTLIFICSCAKKEQQEVSISYDSFDLYLTIPENADAKKPPILLLNYTLKNLDDDVKIFTAKGSQFDETKSVLFLFDSVRKIKLPLYSNHIEFINPNSKIKISAFIDFNEHQDYFKFPNKFLNKLDYASDSIFLRRISEDLIKNSCFYYKQDTSDLQSYRLQNKDVTAISNPSLLKIKKNN